MHRIKLQSIAKSQIFSEVTFQGNKHIVPYIYFIIKFNKLTIQCVPQSQIVKEFTIVNVLTKKQYDIEIESIDMDVLLSGAIYSFEECPTLSSVLLISNVIKDSYSDQEGIVKERMILLGTENKYLTQINQVEEEVNQGNHKFVFYDFFNETIIEIDFGLYSNSDDNKRIQMGFECKLLSINDFITNYLESKALNLFKTTNCIKERIKIKSPHSTDCINKGELIGEDNNQRQLYFDTTINKKADSVIVSDNAKPEGEKEIKKKLIPREKYTKTLDIYSKLDSNYNYINSNNEIISHIANKSSSNANIILIKSIQLPTSLSIEDLFMNAFLIRKPIS